LLIQRHFQAAVLFPNFIADATEIGAFYPIG
jgi:hypothetical protein